MNGSEGRQSTDGGSAVAESRPPLGRLSRRLQAALPDRLAALVSGVRFGQFLSVGVLAAICDSGVLFVLLGVFDVTPVMAKLASAEVGILVAFAANERWTFAEAGASGLGALLRRLATSNLVRLGGLIVGTGVFLLIYHRIDIVISIAGIDLWANIANVIGLGVGVFVNYVAESLFTWRVGE